MLVYGLGKEKCTLWTAIFWAVLKNTTTALTLWIVRRRLPYYPSRRLQLRQEHPITFKSTTRLLDLCPRLPDCDYPQLLHLHAKRLLNDPGEKLILARELLVHWSIELSRANSRWLFIYGWTDYAAVRQWRRLLIMHYVWRGVKNGISTIHLTAVRIISTSWSRSMPSFKVQVHKTSTLGAAPASGSYIYSFLLLSKIYHRNSADPRIEDSLFNRWAPPYTLLSATSKMVLY